MYTYTQQSDVFGFISMVYYNNYMLLPCAHAQQATITIEIFVGYWKFPEYLWLLAYL